MIKNKFNYQILPIMAFSLYRQIGFARFKISSRESFKYISFEEASAHCTLLDRWFYSSEAHTSYARSLEVSSLN